MDLPDFRLGDLPALGDDIRGGGLDPFDIENELKLLRHLEADRRFEEPPEVCQFHVAWIEAVLE